MITSKNTSINSKKVPAIFKKIEWINHGETINVDIGGGKYDTAVEYLKQFGIKNIIFDPYNRSMGENIKTICDVVMYGAESATISNVLNVIPQRGKRIDLLKKAKRWANVVFISVYEGDKSGVGRKTKKDCWQENRKLKEYFDEVGEVFEEYTIHNGMIVAWDSNKIETNL